ncbi:MAG TPA: zf-HC2 domain-containing protein [Candidatus Binataceae bacterium]|nr:zf-HC2 domain-containing protein [Candidatus Binataceae bacterium]
MSDREKESAQFETLIRRAMNIPEGSATSDCPDAETLAAYADRTLASKTVERLDAHFADCARCQAQLAAIVRAATDAEPAAITGLGTWLGVWLTGWRLAIPALATAVALLLIVRSMRPPKCSQCGEVVALGTSHRVLTEAMPEGRPMPESAQPNAALSQGLSVAAASGLVVREKDTGQVEPARPSAENNPAAAAPASPPAVNELAKARSENAYGAMRGGGLSAAAKMAESSNQPMARAQAFAPESSTAPSPPVMAQNAASHAFARPPGFKTITAPGGSVTWIIGQHGLLFRREAKGGLHIVQTGVTADLFAGAAPSDSVCWVVGRSGTILRTTDGVNWQSVAAPSKADLTAIEATSADTAVVSTGNGQRFATTDGGRAWKAEQSANSGQ